MSISSLLFPNSYDLRVESINADKTTIQTNTSTFTTTSPNSVLNLFYTGGNINILPDTSYNFTLNSPVITSTNSLFTQAVNNTGVLTYISSQTNGQAVITFFNSAQGLVQIQSNKLLLNVLII